jgi:hypothetical protein
MSNNNDTLLCARVRRRHYVLSLGFCVIFATMGIATFMSDITDGLRLTDIPISLLMGLLGVVALVLALYFIRLVWRPPVMLEATTQGIVTHFSARGPRSERGYLIPWSVIQSIDL